MLKDVGCFLQLSRFAVVDLKKGPPWSKAHCCTHMGFGSLQHSRSMISPKTHASFQHRGITNNTCSCSDIITSGMKTTHGVFVVGSNSVLLAPCNFMIERANSITAICMPKQIPRYGMLFSRAYFAAKIFPWTPLSPKPPGTSTPSAPWGGKLIQISA